MARLRTLQSKGGINIKPKDRGLLSEGLAVPTAAVSATKTAAARHSRQPAVRKRATIAMSARNWN